MSGLPPLTVDRRYCGPPTSANGGYLAGRLAAYVRRAGPVRVTLRRPPPLDAEIAIAAAGERVLATVDDLLVAEAEPATLDTDPVDPVSFAAATEAAMGYAGRSAHPFPTCFVCGTARSAPDGLGLAPGPVAGRPDTTAAPWAPAAALAGPDHVLPTELVWAALDCPGGWTLALEGRPAVLGRITASVEARPVAGDTCVVMGRLLSRSGRRSEAATTVYDGEGRVLARAAATWVDVDPAHLLPPSS